MSKRISVKVPVEELNEWKGLFNDSDNWGVKTRFQETVGITRNTLNWVLAKGSGYETTVKAIRKFVKRYKSLQDA